MKRLFWVAAIPVLIATAASAATIPIGITGGSISFSAHPSGRGGEVIAKFNLVTTTGSVVGATPGIPSLPYLPTWDASSIRTIDPSLFLYTAGMNGDITFTDLTLTVPNTVRIYNNGIFPCYDELDGQLAVAPLTLDLSTRPSQFSVSVPFTGQVTMSDWKDWPSYGLLNTYVFTGSGVARLDLSVSTFNSQYLLSAESITYTFAPEPQTGYIGLLGTLLTGGWLIYRRLSSRFA